MLDDIPLHDDFDHDEPLPQLEYVELAQIDLKQELAKQLIDAQNLYLTIKADKGVQANQKAQVINSITTIIKQVIDMQERLHNINNLKAIEAALIEALKLHPDLQESFYEQYGKRLGSP